ncbi:hypothetical protein PHISP_08034 [Aspergillus sp. HF37]|nr:hypothetical protein PHISP_08034 [Aspergillus sp. HF37]
MKLSFIATLALAAGAVAQGGGKKLTPIQIPNGEPCKKDGTMGTCQSGYCEQLKDQNQGTCKPMN